MRERHIDDRIRYAAVFPQVTAGTYTVLAATLDVEVPGGGVAEVDLRGWELHGAAHDALHAPA